MCRLPVSLAKLGISTASRQLSEVRHVPALPVLRLMTTVNPECWACRLCVLAVGSAFSPPALRSRRRLCVLAAGSAFSPPALRSRRRLCVLAAGSAFSPPALRSRRRLCVFAADSAFSPPALRSRRRLCVLAAGSAFSPHSPALRLLAGSAAPRRLCGSSPALRLLASSCGSSPALRLLAGSAAPRRLCGSSPALRLLAGSAAPRRLCSSSPALRLLAGSGVFRLRCCSTCTFRLRCCYLARAVPAAGARSPRRAALALLPLVPRTHTWPSLALAGRFPAVLSFCLLRVAPAALSFCSALALRRAPRLPASKNTLASAHDRRTNDATCGPQAWLTGSLHEGGIRSVRSPPRRAPLLATPIAKPLQCGRP